MHEKIQEKKTKPHKTGRQTALETLGTMLIAEQNTKDTTKHPTAKEPATPLVGFSKTLLMKYQSR
jgi:hypothetical protein